jgi:hypothetical protein
VPLQPERLRGGDKGTRGACWAFHDDDDDDDDDD